MDHMRKTEDLLTAAAEARSALKALHATPEQPTTAGRPGVYKPNHRQAAIAAVYDEIRHLTATAKIHATLAVAQATYDAASLREVIDSQARRHLDDSGKGADE